MKWTRCVALTGAVALATTLVGSVALAKGGGGASPQATDIGVTPTEIHVGVLADVDNAFQPGLFQGSVDAVKGWAKFMNSKGGLAKRKVVVDFIDTHLSNSDARNAIISACQNDFAIVGTTALFVNNVDDLVGCKDKLGAATGLPDFPVVTTEPVHQCSTVSFAVLGQSLDCATRQQPVQSYRSIIGASRHYLQQFGKLHGVFIYPSDLRAAKNSQVPLFHSQQRLGIKADKEFDISALAPQSGYTPIVQFMKEKGSTYARNGGAFSGTVALRKEAKLQGLTSVKVWDCTLQCYDRRLIEQGGADVEGQFITLSFLPFGLSGGADDTKSNKMLANFVKFTGKDKVDGFGAQAWAAGIYFRDVVNAVVKDGGENSLTRAAVLKKAPSVNGFSAEGMIAKTDVGTRTPSTCYVIMQVKNGKFVRVFPTKPGTFHCDPKDLVTIKLSLIE
jgi:hypothetical protein